MLYYNNYELVSVRKNKQVVVVVGVTCEIRTNT